MLDLDTQVIWKTFLESKNPLGILYHYTHLSNLADIVESDKFNLTFASGANEKLTKGKKMFYLSTTRTPVGEYAYPYYKNDIQILIVLDAGKLSRKYKIVPIDYWGRQEIKRDEAEERIVSEKDEIPASPYIKEVRIYIPENYDLSERNESRYFRLLIDSRIKIKIWDNLNYFLTGRGKEVTERYICKRYDEEMFDGIKWLSSDIPPDNYYYDWKRFKKSIHNNLKSKIPIFRKAYQELANLIKKNKVRSLDELIKKKVKESLPKDISSNIDFDNRNSK